MGNNPSRFNGVRGEGEEWEIDYGTDPTRPVETDSWNDAVAYCAALTGPNQRAANGKAQRKFDRRNQVAARLGRSAWVRVIGDAIAAQTLPGTDGWARCDFIGPSKITIDAGREMAQEREDVARGLMTRRDHYGNRGRSWRRETDQALGRAPFRLEGPHLVLVEAKSFRVHLRELEAAGFRTVPVGTSGFPTAFISEWTQGNGGPVIGFLPEYDALPRLGNAPVPR